MSEIIWPDRDHPWPLVGLTEIAMAAGVQKPVVSMWRTRGLGFPEAVVELAGGGVFFWPDVQEWLLDTGRKTDAGWTRDQVNQSSGRSYADIERQAQRASQAAD